MNHKRQAELPRLFGEVREQVTVIIGEGFALWRQYFTQLTAAMKAWYGRTKDKQKEK